MTDDERLALYVEAIELANVERELRERGHVYEADLLAIRVAELVEQLYAEPDAPIPPIDPFAARARRGKRAR